nr:hypothetical protein [Tanacetum cinerariifolium]
MTRKPSIPRRNRINWHYVRDDVLFSTIKVAAPKPKASGRKKKGDSASSTIPPTPTPITTLESAPRLSATAKEEELAKNDDEDTETGKGGDEVSESEETGKGGDEVSESEGESEEEEEETRQEEEESFDPIPRTPEGSEEESDDEEDQELRLSKEARIQEEKEADELYRDVNINPRRGLQVTQNVEDSHVTLTSVNPDGPQESSSMSSFVTSMLNLTSDVGVESIFTTASSPIVSLQSETPIMTPSTIATITTSSDAPIPDVGVESIFTTASSPIVSLQSQTPIMTPSTIATITTSSDAPIPSTTIPSIILENLPTFNSAFCFGERLRSLETSFSEYRQTNPFVDAVSMIPGIVQQYMTQQMTEAVRVAVQI